MAALATANRPGRGAVPGTRIVRAALVRFSRAGHASTPPRCAAGAAAGWRRCARHQHEIDELNVYPVPDGDTGTNLVLTLTSAQQALEAELDRPSRRGAADARSAGRCA